MMVRPTVASHTAIDASLLVIITTIIITTIIIIIIIIIVINAREQVMYG